MATFKAKLGTGANAPVVDLGTERKSRADRKVAELRTTYPEATLLPQDSDAQPTQAAPIKEGEWVWGPMTETHVAVI